MRLFYKQGNGIKTLLDKTGRITDFRGLFVIVSADKRQVIVRESDQVLTEIQKTVRGKRVKDQKLLKRIARLYGFKSALAGQEYLKSMEVKMLEIFDESKRIALAKATLSSNVL